MATPLPSKDGKKLFVIGIQQRAELVRYDAKSGEFIPYLGGISAGDVDFSRDGQWVTLCQLSRQYFMAQQAGRQLPLPAYLSSHARRPWPTGLRMGSRSRSPELRSRQAVEGIPDFKGRRQSRSL